MPSDIKLLLLHLFIRFVLIPEPRKFAKMALEEFHMRLLKAAVYIMAFLSTVAEMREHPLAIMPFIFFYMIINNYEIFVWEITKHKKEKPVPLAQGISNIITYRIGKETILLCLLFAIMENLTEF